MKVENKQKRPAAFNACCCVALLFVQCMFVAELQAFEWTASDVQLLYGGDFEFGPDSRTTVTVEHAHGWQYGTNFFFVDIYDNGGSGPEVYAEVYAYFSLNKITGWNWSFGPIKDVSLMGGLNISNVPEQRNFKAYLFGASLDFANPYFDYLQLDITAYKDDAISGRYGIQFTPVWSMPFTIGPAKFKFRGFIDFRDGNTNTSNNFQMLAQPQLLFDVGHAVNWKSDSVYIGSEYSYWHNKFGIEDIRESAFQAMIIGFF